MKSVSKQQAKQIEEAQAKYEDAHSAVSDTLADAKQRIEDLISQCVSDVNLKIGKLNEAKQALDAIRDEVASDIESFIDEKSDAWRDGDRGSSYSEWHDAWQNAIEDMDEMDIPSIDDVFSEIEGALDEQPEEPLNDDDYPREPSL